MGSGHEDIKPEIDGLPRVECRTRRRVARHVALILNRTVPVSFPKRPAKSSRGCRHQWELGRSWHGGARFDAVLRARKEVSQLPLPQITFALLVLASCGSCPALACLHCSLPTSSSATHPKSNQTACDIYLTTFLLASPSLQLRHTSRSRQ